MNAVRKVLLPLLVIPLAIFLYVFTHPDWQWDSSGLDLLFAIVGIPILIGNFIAWFYPEMIQTYFPVKEDWGEQRGKPAVTLAIGISTLTALLCVGAGAVSAISSTSPRPTFKSSTPQPAAATALARSSELQSEIANSSETDIVPIPEPATQASVTPEQTPQIPVSGGASVNLPTLSATQTGIVSPFSTQTNSTAPAVSTAPTTTGSSSALCTPASADYLDAVLQVVQDIEPDNQVTTGWVVQSKAAPNLWFVATKISGSGIDSGTTLPGVWGLFVDSGGTDIFAINDVAKNISDADPGQDSNPVLTMQSDGAQTSYNCAQAH